MHCTRVITTALLIVTALPGGAHAQDPASAGPRFQIFRYASHSAIGMYSGYSTGSILLVGGVLSNPRTGSHELMAAAGVPVPVTGGNVTFAVAGAHTTTGWYAQLYVIPSIRLGALSAEATVKLGEPLQATGFRGLSVSPGNALLHVGPTWAAGLGYYASIKAGSDAYHGVGPAVRRTIPRGSLTLEWILGVTGGDNEIRATMRTAF